MTHEVDETRVSIRLSPQAKVAVDKIMSLGEYKTLQEAIRRAISDELFLQQARKDGWTVRLQKGSDSRELVWAD